MSMPARPNLDAQQDALKARLKKEIMRELVLELNLDKPTVPQRIRRFLTEEKRKWRRHPFSALARLLCRLAMLITMFCLLYLVGDVLVKGLPLTDPQPGDLLCFGSIGAYSVTEGMYLFLSRALPLVALYTRQHGAQVVRPALSTAFLNSAFSKKGE